jgi:hypothetical protein
MAIFRRLIQNPTSPEKSLKALTGAAKYKGATFARLADLNDLSRSVDDAIPYTLPLTVAATGTQAITTKKGIIKITTSNTGTLTITLTNSEFLLADVDKYFVCGTVAHASINAIVTFGPITADGSMTVRISQNATTTAWTTVYLNYNIVRTGD